MNSFLTNYKIDLGKLPKYSEFKGEWKEPLDYALANIIAESNATWNTDKIKKTYKNAILSHINSKTGVLTSTHYQVGNLGRFYPTNYSSMSTMRKHIKHTMFSFLGWKDLDMIKGHPSILTCLATANGDVLPAFSEYLENSDNILQILREFHDDPVKPVLQDKDVKELLNLTIYGGDLSVWVFNLTKGKKMPDGTYDPEHIPKNVFCKEEHPFYTRFKKERNQIAQKLFDSNPEIMEVARKQKLIKGETRTSKIENCAMSMCCGILENQIVFTAYKFLKQRGIIKSRTGGLEMDGLNIPPFDETNIDLEQLIVDLNKHIVKTDKMAVKFKFKAYESENVHTELHVLRRNMSIATLKTPIQNGDDVKDGLEFESFSDLELAKNAYSLFGETFILQKSVLYHYNGVYWETQDTHNLLKKMISEELTNIIKNKITALEFAKKSLSVVDDLYEVVMKKISLLTVGSKKLENNTNLNSVVAMIMMYIEKNVEYDENPYLFAFNNRIYDLEKGEFIEPKPEQYITTTTGYDWDYKYDDKNKNDLQSILNTIFIDKNERDFVMSCFATGMVGIQLQNFIVNTGFGANGKSLLDTLMMNTIGNYGLGLSTAVLTTDIKAGANPELANLHNKRYGSAGEPTKGTKLCSAVLKKITGDPFLACRGLYEKGEKSINLRVTTMLNANTIPELDEVGDSIIRRFIVIAFVCRFLQGDNYENYKDEPNVFPANPYYVTPEFMNKYKQAFFLILAPFAKTYCDTKALPPTPKLFLIQTHKYLVNTDNIVDWVSEICEEHAGGCVKLSDLYNVFKCSDTFKTLDKKMQRDNNRKKFLENVETNPFLRKKIMRRDEYYNGIQLKSDCLVGWRIIEEKEEQQV